MSAVKTEWYLLIEGEEAKRISEEQANQIAEVMESDPMPYFLKFEGNMYKTRSLQIRKKQQEYL